MKNLLPLALAFLPVGLTAQIAIETEALTPIGIASTVPPNLVGVPAGPLSLPLFLATPGTSPTLRLSLYTTVDAASARLQFNTLGLLYGTEAGVTPSTAALPAFGPVALLVTFVGTPGLTGNINANVIRSVSPALPTSLTNQCAVDVGNDGTFEAAGPGPVTVPVRMPASGRVPVRIVLENHGFIAAGLLVSVANVALEFVADPITTCSITAYGTGCGGMQSSGTSVQLGTVRSIALLGSGSNGQSMVLSAFGLSNSGPSLPGGCVLATDAMFVVPLVSDRFGYVSQTLTVPATAAGLVYHQFVGLDPSMGIAASNGLEIDCVR